MRSNLCAFIENNGLYQQFPFLLINADLAGKLPHALETMFARSELRNEPSNGGGMKIAKSEALRAWSVRAKGARCKRASEAQPLDPSPHRVQALKAQQDLRNAISRISKWFRCHAALSALLQSKNLFLQGFHLWLLHFAPVARWTGFRMRRPWRFRALWTVWL